MQFIILIGLYVKFHKFGLYISNIICYYDLISMKEILIILIIMIYIQQLNIQVNQYSNMFLKNQQ